MKNTHDILIKQKVEFALLNHKLMRFDYVDKEMALTVDRLYEPILLLPKEGEPNRVAANKFPDGDQRVFSFSGIQNLKLEEYDKIY